jgi:hypothetical protein
MKTNFSMMVGVSRLFNIFVLTPPPFFRQQQTLSQGPHKTLTDSDESKVIVVKRHQTKPRTEYFGEYALASHSYVISVTAHALHS